MPARGGRARSKSALRIVTRTPAAATAPSAASVARGRRRLRQSPAAAIAANSGHLTHQADASRSTNVSRLPPDAFAESGGRAVPRAHELERLNQQDEGTCGPRASRGRGRASGRARARRRAARAAGRPRRAAPPRTAGARRGRRPRTPSSPARGRRPARPRPGASVTPPSRRASPGSQDRSGGYASISARPPCARWRAHARSNAVRSRSSGTLTKWLASRTQSKVRDRSSSSIRAQTVSAPRTWASISRDSSTAVTR